MIAGIVIEEIEFGNEAEIVNLRPETKAAFRAPVDYGVRARHCGVRVIETECPARIGVVTQNATELQFGLIELFGRIDVANVITQSAMRTDFECLRQLHLGIQDIACLAYYCQTHNNQ